MLPLLISACIVIAIALFLLSARQIVAEVPTEDRQFMDKPPRFYRLTGPLVRLVAHYCAWAVSEAAATRIKESLRRAGQDYTLTAVQFFAGKIVAAILFGAMLAWVASKIHVGAFAGLTMGAALGFFLPERWLADMAKARNLKILKRLPF